MRLLALAAAAVVAVATACTGGDATQRVSDDLHFEEFDGTQRALAEYDGRPLVLNFFASWCPPCVREMPAIEAVHRTLGDDVAFLGLAVNETAEDSQALVEETGITYDTARDPRAEILQALGGVVMPTTFLIDGGEVVATHAGDITEDELTDLIEEHFRD